MESILQQFLTSQIINIEEDQNHEKLIKASNELVKSLSKDKQKVHKITLAAFDGNIEIDNPYVTEVKNLIIKHWSTFINKCQNTPLTYIRAVMLESLQSISNEDQMAAIIWLTISNISRFYKSEAREEEILQSFLLDCFNKYELVSIQKWSLNNVKVEFQIKVPESEESNKLLGIKKEFIVEKLSAAVNNGKSIAQNNSGYGASNVLPDWATDFSKVAGEALNSVFSTIVNQANDSIKTKVDSKILNALVESLNKEMSDAFNKVINTSSSTELRGKLLWFKEALYSSTQNCSFRKLSNDVSTIAMAFEFSNIVLEYNPISTNYVLTETLYQSNPTSFEETSFGDFISSLEPHKAVLKQYFEQYTTMKEGRSSLVEFIAFFINGTVGKTQFLNKVGLDPEEKISWADLAVWLYQDLQSIKFFSKKG